MKRVVVAFLLLIVSGVVALWWLGKPYVLDRLRTVVEREVTGAVGSPCTIGELDASLWPPRVSLGGVVIGHEPTLAQIGRVEAHLFLLASLEEGRPVLTLTVDGPELDATQLPKSPPRPAGAARPAGRTLPPIDLKSLEVTRAHARFPMDHSVGDLTVERLAAHAQLGLLRRQLTAGVEVTGVVLQRKVYRVSIDEIRADGGFDAGGLFVQTATVKGEGINATVSATAVAHRHTASATFQPGILGMIVDELSFIGGQAQLDGTLTGDLANPVLDGQLVIRDGAIGRHTLGDLDTHVTRAGTKLSFDEVRLTGKPGQVTGAVELIIEKEIPIRGDLSWHGVDLEGLLAIIGTSVPLDNRFEATTAVRGQLDPLDLDIKGNGTLQGRRREAAVEVAKWEIGGTVRPHAVDARLELAQPERNQVSVKFLLNDPQLGGTVNLAAADLAALRTILPRPVSALDVTGHGEGTAALSGTTDHPAIGGSLNLKDVTIARTLVPQLSGDFAIARQALVTKSMRLAAAAGAADLRGTLALDSQVHNDWQVRIDDLDANIATNVLQSFAHLEVPISRGVVAGTVQCRGPWPQADMQADLSARSFFLGREPIERIDLKASTTFPRWTLHATGVHAAGETVTVDASGRGATGLEVALHSTPFELKHFRDPKRRRLAGTVTAEGQLSGDLQRLDGVLQISGAAIALRGHELGDVALRAEGKQGAWTLQGSALQHTFDIGATLRTTPALPYTLNVDWVDAQLGKVISPDQSLRVTATGALRLTGSLRAPTAPSGSVQLSRFEVTRDQGEVSATEPIRIDIDNGRFTIRSLRLAGVGSQLSIGGDWTLAGEANLEAHGQGELVLLELVGPPFQSARGQFSVSGQVRRAPGSGWNVRGEATVRDVALDLGLPVSFTDTNGAFTLTGGTIRVDSLGGKTGGGEFQVNGDLDLNHGPALSWTVKEVGLTLPEWLEERVTGGGRLEGTWRAMTMNGDVELLNALYDRNIELKDLLPWFKEQIAPAPRGGTPPVEVRLALHLHASGGLFVDNNLAKVEMRADLRISGTTDTPVLNGTIEFIGGEVTFRDRRFQITGGAIDFRDQLGVNPILNISAESLISTSDAEYTVTVTVTGTAENPRVLFSADDPNLSQNDVLSLVTFGKTSPQLQKESGGVGVGDVLGLVPAGGVQQRVRTLFGVDRIEVEPSYVRDTGAIEARVTIGKDITDRLRALGSTSLGVDARNSMQLEYRITRRISLLGSWEGRTQSQAGAFGGDIKFRYEFRKVPFSLFGDGSSQGDAR